MAEEGFYDEALGGKLFMSWSKENAMWWISYRTTKAGSFDAADIAEWKKCTVKYIIFFDHTKEEEARLFSLRILERDSHFKAVKVSKFARDGEKIIVFIGKDDTRKKKVSELANEFGFALWEVRDIDTNAPLEQHLEDKYGEYLRYLSQAFRGMEGDGGVRVNATPF